MNDENGDRMAENAYTVVQSPSGYGKRIRLPTQPFISQMETLREDGCLCGGGGETRVWLRLLIPQIKLEDISTF